MRRSPFLTASTDMRAISSHLTYLKPHTGTTSITHVVVSRAMATVRATQAACQLLLPAAWPSGGLPACLPDCLTD